MRGSEKREIWREGENKIMEGSGLNLLFGKIQFKRWKNKGKKVEENRMIERKNKLVSSSSLNKKKNRNELEK